MRQPTNYNKQHNRCKRCGHKLVMHYNDGHYIKCTVVTGHGNDPANNKKCECRL